MGCRINDIKLLDGSPSKLGNKLLNLLNGNYAKAITYLSIANSKDFNDWFVTNGGTQVTDSYDGRKVSSLISAINEYRKSFDYNIQTARNSKSNNVRLFDNIADEEHAVNVLTTMYLEAEDYLINNKKSSGNLTNIRAYLAKRLVDHYKNPGLTESQREFTKKLLLDVMPLDANKQAKGSKIISSVIKDSKVIHLSRSLNLYEETNIFDESQTNSDEAEDVDVEAIDDNASYKDWNDAMAKHVSKTISKEIKRIFNSVKQLSSIEYVGENGVFNEKTDTPSGIAETMNFNDCLSNIIAFGEFKDINSFVESLHTIASTKEGMMGLEAIYNKALTDKTFATKLFVNFNQRLIKRNQVTYSSNDVTSDLTNPNSNPALILRNKILSGINRSINSNITPLSNRLNLLNINFNNRTYLQPMSINDIKYNSGIEMLADIYSYLGLGISENGIRNYIYNSSDTNSNINTRFKRLLEHTESLINIIKEAKEISTDNKDRYKAAYKAWIKEKQYVEESGQGKVKPIEEFGNITANPVITDSSLHKILNISNAIAKHESVIIDLNSRDIQNQLVTDTIKNSYLSRFFHRYQYADNAEKYFITKAKFRQYEKSNVLFEQVDDKGKIVIPGILRKVDNGYQLTEYYDFLDIELFNGAKNESLNTAATYSQMSAADFDITTVCQYINNSYNNTISTNKSGTAKFKAAKYFIQTPSDAPNTYMIRSYALSIKGLIKENGTKVIGKDKYTRSEVEKDTNSLYIFTDNTDRTSNVTNSNIKSDSKYAKLFGSNKNVLSYGTENNPTSAVIRGLDNAFPISTMKYYRGVRNQTIEQARWNDSDFNEFKSVIDVEFDVISNELKSNNYKNIVFPGSIDGLFNSKIANISKERTPKLYEYLNNKLEVLKNSLSSTQSINREHPIYKALKNIYEQEITDMRQAYETIFERDATGLVVRNNTNKNAGEKGAPVIKAKLNDLYEKYHFKNGKVVDDNERLVGNVFQFWNLLVDPNSDNPLDDINKSVDNTIDGMYEFLYTADTDSIINEHLDRYIAVKTQEAIDYYSQYRSNIKDYNEDMIKEMALNYTIQFVNFNELFSGNLKFYKDARDTIKRNKETQAGGVSYGTYSIDNVNASDNEVIDNITIGNKTIPITNNFKYITVVNTNKPTDNIKGIEKLLPKDIDSDTKAFILGKYTDKTKVNDAQSYITLDEFVRRVYLSGQYEDYKDTVEALYDESKPIDYAKLGKLIQVQKNFYYELQADEAAGLEVPVQIKNAEFVLIPRFIKGTELEVLNETMISNGIHQTNTVETEKAANNRNLTLWNEKGVITKTNFTKFKTAVKSNIKTGYYTNLYKQQDTPQHMDAENKAGIQIVKKMVDNLHSKEGLTLKTRFFNLYTANIRNSFKDLARELNLTVDENDNVVLDDNGKVTTINKAKFYDMVYDELARTDANSNLLSYAMLSPTGEPLMPNYIGTVRRKMMSVFQSIFTNNITNQKLPGFHGAQVSNIGFKPTTISESEYLKTRSASGEVNTAIAKKLEYHKDGNPYIEILLPRHSKKLYTQYNEDGSVKKEFTIEELKEAGLDMMIGYRIPTEGKQSVVMMKVVGFLDESQGSTIVVPDEFVTQTGSDFDIDSIYGIYHNFTTKDGKLIKIEYSENTDKDSVDERYINYIRSAVRKLKSDSISFTLDEDEKNSIASKLNSLLDKEYDNYFSNANNKISENISDYSEIWQELDDNAKEAIKTIDAETKDIANFKEKLISRTDAINSMVNNSEYEADKENLQSLVDIYKNTIDVIDLKSKLGNLKHEQNVEIVAEAFKSANKDKALYVAETNAEKLGLYSREQFESLPIEDQNSKEARENAIVDTFLDIMSLPETSEENLMCSNFEDIKDAKKWVFGKIEKFVDINSIIGQSNYRNQVMSGATLKAISVKRDNFCSISNTAKTTITDNYAVIVKYDYASSPVGEYKKQKAYAISNYGKDHVTANDEHQTIAVVHDKLGWSLNGDRNIEGKLMTVYSSETTALILDGVKEGGIMNVNTYTFDVFKTLIDLGIDYKTAVAFMVQDGITKINEHNDNANSIYNSDRDNPIIAATKSILIDYIKTNNSNAKLTKYNSVNELLIAADIKEEEFSHKDLNSNKLKEIYNSKDIDAREKVVHDLSVIENFKRFKELSDAIGSHAGVMNLDKVGASQSVFSARKIISSIKDLSRIKPILNSAVTNSSLINAVYPDIRGEANIDKSVYPSLYANYKYCLLNAGKIVSSLFETESQGFNNIKNMLPSNVDENTVHKFENYVVLHALNETKFVSRNIFISNNETIDYTNENDTELENARRITGYNQSITYDIDLTNPEAFADFVKLTPANKVYILKNKVKGESLLDYLNVELVDTKKANKGLSSPQKVTVMSNTVDSNKLIDLFKNMYYSEDPFVRAAAQDLIRYSIVAEGFSYGFNKISNIVPVEILYNTIEDGGIGLIEDSNNNLNTMINSYSVNFSNIVDNFFRSNLDSKYIPKYENKWSPKHKQGRIRFDNNGIALIDVSTAISIGLVENSYIDNVTGSPVYRYKSYIKTNKFKEGVKNPELSLYKVYTNGSGIYLYPANMLEYNEPRTYSVNPNNNVNPASSIYEEYINDNKDTIPNSFKQLERARLEHKRSFIAVPNMLNAITRDINNNIILNYLRKVSSTIVGYERIAVDKAWGQVSVVTNKFGDNNATDNIMKANLKDLAENNIRIVMIDGSKSYEMIKYLEEELGYSNYQVIYNSNDSKTRDYINECNRKDARTRFLERLNNYNASVIKIDTNVDQYKQFITKLTADGNISKSLLHRVHTDGFNYTTITSLMASRINLNPDTRAKITIENIDYLITNLGEANSKSLKSIPTYKKDGEFIDNLFSDNDRSYKNIIKIEDFNRAVEEADDADVFESSNEDLDANINNLINDHLKGIEANAKDTDSMFGNSEFVRDIKKQFRELNLHRNNKDVYNDTIRAIALSKASLSIEQQALFIKNKFEHFYDEPTKPNEPISATNPLKVYKLLDAELYDKLDGNPALQQAFFKLLLDTETFVSDNESFAGINLYSNEDIANAADDRARKALIDANQSIATIKNQVNDIKVLLTNSHKARDLFFDRVIAKVSTNEMVAKDLQQISKSYRDDSWFRSWATNAAESGIPLIQAVMKRVNGSVYAAQMEANRKATDFKNKLAAIKAESPGIKILDLIDDSGRLVKPYTEDLVKDMQRKKQDLDVIKARYGENSIKYIKAKNDYNDWLTDNIHREYVSAYYAERSEIEHILDDYDDVRTKLNRISAKQRDIMSRMIGNDYTQLTDNERKELNNLAKERKLLTSTTYQDGSPKEGKDYYDAMAANNYLNNLTRFRNKYQETITKDGFEDMLKDNLNIVSRIRSVKAESELATDVAYQTAMKWINENTNKKIDEELLADIKEAFKLLKSTNLNSAEFAAIMENKYDDKGIIDGSKFTDVERANIRKSQADKFKGQNNEDVVRLIRNNTHPKYSNTIYTRGFYNSLRSDKVSTDERNAIIKEINAILGTQFVPNENRVESYNLSIEELDKLAKLYEELNDNPKEDVSDEYSSNRAKFIHNNVDFTYDDVEFERQRIAAQTKGQNYYKHWLAANTEEEFNYATKSYTGKILPNSELYGIAKPRNMDKFTDHARTNAKKLLDANVEFVPTAYYVREFEKHRRLSDAEFNKWYHENHVFNPNTQLYEPLRIWQQMEVKDKTKVKYEPKAKWTTNKVRDEFKNSEYEFGNLKLNTAYANDKYKSSKYVDIINNPAKKKLYDLVHETLNDLVVNPRSKSFVDKGFIPFESLSEERKDLKSYAKAIQEAIGIYDVPMKSEDDDSFGKRAVNMPMLYRINPQKLNPIPVKDESMTDEEYANELARVYNENNEIQDANEAEHRKRMNENLEDVFSKFIIEASRFNSIQENSKLLRLTLDELKDMKFYKLDSKGHPIVDKSKSKITGNTEYVMKDGGYGSLNFEEYMKRIIYNEFENDEGWKTKGTRVFKNFVSLRFMAGNITSGISNVTYGESQILMEALGKEFLSVADRNKGIMDYRKGIVSYFADYESATTNNLTSALIKLVDVIDLDTVTEVEGNNGKVGKAYKKITTVAYLQQSIGEHFMQNSTMLGMMYSHRVIDVNGKKQLMSKEMFSRHVREEAFKTIAKKYDKAHGTHYIEDYNKFVNKLKDNDNVELRQKYIDFKRDIVEDFLLALPNSARKEFIELNKVKKDEATTIFETYPTLRDSFELKNGLAVLKEDSGLTYEDIGLFKNKVIEVNHKIHGVYNKINSARAQSYWWGSMVFQFHKHLIPGIAKRYGYVWGKGVYNEAREAVDKGMYVSLGKFLASPFKATFKASEVTDEVNAIEATRNFMNYTQNLIVNCKMYYDIMPEYDKANLRRCLGEAAAILGALMLYIAGRMMWDDDDKETQVADYMMYLGDRLSSESIQYTAYGAPFEAYKLYSNPVASFAIVKDLGKGVASVGQYLLTGDKADLYYQTGTNYGKSKITTNLLKQVPIYNQYMKHERLGSNNSYYKTGNNMIGVLPVRDWIDKYKKNHSSNNN